MQARALRWTVALLPLKALTGFEQLRSTFSLNVPNKRTYNMHDTLPRHVSA